ncbi:uncharacterized protein TRAVEDRAFT_73151 [Trametes versicolor FP-101664 SS1]|uniref:uncharacterized protein n=1 Tax=Trametes versicolor (strain FP-101664) TaxID=717944 RepID=UPI0004623CA9|nr:uncharacterized protein TRAVEDRAFT_73151 [Trametes versicolor FP-101664 SS1]EIW56689.1 hypothetical protein TRAVEDRAFT_73151 [Trametes versicolor FP-101664 SS1]
MDVLTTILRVSRPPGWCFGPILYAIGAIHGRGPVRGYGPLLLQLLSLSFPLALVVFGVNDVYDYDTDLLNPRKTADGLEGTVLSPAYHTPVLVSAALASLLIMYCSALTRTSQNLLTTLLLLALSWSYSTPPLRLKERPILDSLSNGLIVILAYLSGYTARGGRLLRPPAKGLVLGLCTAGVHALGAAVDARADAAAGQRTIATVFGADGAVAFAALSYFVALCAEGSFTSIFGVYLLGGLGVTLLAFLDLDRAHLAFRLVVYWTVGMSSVWFADKVLAKARELSGFDEEHEELGARYQL